MAKLVYEVSFKGAASETLCAAFGVLEVRSADRNTVVRCTPDQLQEVLDLIESFALELRDIHLVAEPAASGTP